MLALAVAPASAQQDQGMIAGRVTDPTDALVPAVTITATAETGVTIQTRTNADGHYVLAPLVIGLYRVSIEVPGFKRAVSDPIQVHANTRARLDVQLELGAVNDTISVRSPAPLLQTDTSSLSHTIGASQIGQLPLNGRNFSQLATLAAGVLPAFGHVQRESGFNSNGQWAVQNNFLLDGVDKQLAGDGLPGPEGAGTGAEYRRGPGVPGSNEQLHRRVRARRRSRGQRQHQIGNQRHPRHGARILPP
ncbi:carboxypeptidase-like regulatory domain-containing protein [Luteitalea pratensis]|uniref:carboxypeptidase-like regulatory domain-containing protein n=1 Tax=Luteitalea pratensis TaxID=1855912 RepID=UPI0012FF992A|nr:carboxypeptidase-like regulatory domain-containing protein [Luteitalea pratensis]